MVVITFLLFEKIGISLSDSLPRWNFSRPDWVQFYHLCKEKLSLDTIELYEEPIFYVILLIVVCQEPLQTRVNAVHISLTRNVKTQWKPESQP